MAYGAQPLFYQWLKEGIAIEAQTNQCLVLTNLLNDQAGAYAVVVSNALGVVTSTPALLVLQDPPPLITRQPVQQFMLWGDAATMEVEASGPGPLRYQWFKDGHELTGQTNALLRWTSLQMEDAGDYWIVVSNHGGMSRSQTARLAVRPLRVTSFNNYWEVAIGHEIWLSYEMAGHGPFTSQWMKEDAPLPDATNNWLSIEQTWPSDAGQYTLVVSNPAGILKGDPIQVKVMSLVITTQHVDLAAPLDGNATLFVSALGHPPLSYQWRKNGIDLPGRTDNFLVLEHLQYEDAGLYSVMIANPEGSIQSREAALQIQSLMILQSPGPQVMAEGGRATFAVVAAGRSPIACQWFKNGMIALPGQTNSSLVLENVQPSDAASYFVRVSNSEYTLDSEPAPLLVQPLAFIDWPQNNTLQEGDPVILKVTVFGHGPFSYQWSFNNAPLPNATNHLLAWPSAKLSDSGLYSVIVTNLQADRIAGDAVLTVLPRSARPGRVDRRFEARSGPGGGTVDDLRRSWPALGLGCRQ